MKKPEYQHFNLVNRKTSEKVSVKIGPLPVRMREFGDLIDQELIKNGKELNKDWDITKAWVSE